MYTTIDLFRSRVASFIVSALILAFGAYILFAGQAQAAISGGTVAGNAAADLVVGATNVDYNVSFDTDVGADALQLWVIFPEGYTITNGSLTTSAISDGSTTGFISVNGVPRDIDNVMGDSANRKITITLKSAYDVGTGTGASFRILSGIQNPTTSGATGAFTIDSDAAGEVEQNDVAAVTLTAGDATYLSFTQEPVDGSATHGDVISGTAFATQPTITAYDTYDNIATGFTGTVTLAEGTGAGTLGGTVFMDAVGGIADFAGKGVKYTAATDQETFTVVASSGELTTDETASLTADVVATQLVVATNPGDTNATNGDILNATIFETQPVIEFRDGDGLVDTDIDTDVVTVSLQSGAGTLVTTLTATAANGVATFSDLAYTLDGTENDQQSITLRFTDDGGGDIDLNGSPVDSVSTVDVVATQLSVSVQPANIVSGVSMTAPVVQFLDAQNKIDVDIDTDVLTATENGNGSITAGATATAANGVATFSSLIYTAAADGEAVTFTFTDDVGGVDISASPVSSNEVTADVVAVKIIINTQPSGSVSRSALTGQPVIYFVDANDTLDTQANTDTVTAMIASGDGSLSGDVDIAAVNGVVTFTDLTYTATADQENFTLSFSDDAGGTNDFSLAVAITSNAVTSDVVAVKIIINTQPSGSTSGNILTGQPVIYFVDAGDVLDTQANTDTITASVFSGGGSLSGDVDVLAVNGVVAFTDLTYTATADQQEFVLRFTDDAIGTNAFNGSPVNANTVTSDVTATKFLVVLDSYTPTAGSAATLTITAVDANNITDTEYDETGLSYTFIDSEASALSTHTAPDGTAPTIPSSADIQTAFGGDGVAGSLSITLTKAEILGTITVTDGSISGTSPSVTVRHGSTDNFLVTVSDDTPTTGTPISVIITARDQYNNTASGVNGATAYTGTVFLSTNATEPTWHTPWTSFITADAGTKTLSNAVTFNTVEGSITVTAQETDGSPTGTTSSITASSDADVTAPTVESQTPLDNATGVAINVSPTITFSEAMDATSLGATIQLRTYSDDVPVSATIQYNPLTYVVTIDPVADLANSTQYYIWVSGAKDASGNTVTAYTTKASQEFTTGAESVALAVTRIDGTKTTMTADATYTNGGSWTMNITVPTNETQLQVKFGDWVSGSNSILTANNMRIYSAQSSNAADIDNAITITAEDTYSSALILTSDLDSTTAGRQIQVVIDLKVPTGTSGGSYSTNYAVQSSVAE